MDYLITEGGGVLDAGDGDNNISIASSAGGNNTVNSGSGNDTINVEDRDETEEQRYRNNFNVGDGNNYINNSDVELSTISAGSGNDTIITGGGTGYYNWSGDNGYPSISAGAGDNKISVNSNMSNGSITAENGNDLVSVSGGGSNNNISVSGGDDSVIADINSSTINLGAGKNLVSLNGSSGNDIIAGSGNDSVLIINSGGNNSASLGSGSNTLISENGSETVTAGDDDDFITVAGGNIDVGGGANNVSLTQGSYTTVTAGDGDDTIDVADVGEQRYRNIFDAGDGNNYINNSNVELSTISTGSGNDTIITGGGTGYYNWSGDNGYPSISAGAGDNKISVNSNMTYGTITAEGGNDLVSILGDGGNNLISVGNGRNTVITNNHYDYTYNTGNTIEAGDGSDVIYTIGRNSYINVGSGRNFISLGSGYNNTIIAGKGNDTIIFGDNANNNVIIFGEGNDIVYNYHSGDVVKAVGELTQNIVGNDIVLTDGTSRMTLVGAVDKTINTEELSSNNDVYKILVADKTVGDTVLPEGMSDTTPSDTTSPDTTPSGIPSDAAIYNGHYYYLFDNGLTWEEAKAYCESLGGHLAVITSESEQTFIENLLSYNGSKNNYWLGGFKNDNEDWQWITNENFNFTNWSSTQPDNYMNSEDKIMIYRNSNPADWAANLGFWNDIRSDALVDGNDSDFFGTGNFGFICEWDNTTDTTPPDTTPPDTTPSSLNISNDADSTLITGSELNETITNSGDLVTIDGGAGDDEITNSGERVSIAGGRGNDLISNEGDEVTIDGGAGSDQITNAGNNSEIFGGNGNDTITNGQYNSNTISGGKGNDSIINDGGAGLIFVYNEGDGNDFIEGFNETSTLSISGSEYSSLVSGDDVIISVDAGAITLSGASKLSEIYINGTEQDLVNLIVRDSTRSPLTLGEETENADASNRTKAIRIIGNDKDNLIVATSGNDTLDGAAGDDTLTGGKGNDLFVFSGGRDVISDYSQKGTNGKDKISIASDLIFKEYEVAAGNVVLTYTDGNGNDQTLTITDGAGKEINFGTTIAIYERTGIFSTNGKQVSLAAGIDSFEATKNYSKLLTIDGATADDVEIVGNKKANYIVAGKGNSTLSGGKGKDTLVGGDGDDVFVFANKSGNKLIRNYGEDDLISLSGGAALSEVQTKSNNLVLKVGKNKITIEGGADNPFTFDDGEEKTYSNGLITSGNSVSLTTAFDDREFNLNGTDYRSADASLLKKNISLVGNSEANYLIGGKGNDTLTAGSGGASLWGGKGNDSLIGDTGKDTFIFRAGDGTDTISGYGDGDLLQILDKRGNRAVNYSKAAFSDGTLTLSVKGGGKIILEGMSTGGVVNINGTEHTISGKGLRK